MTEFRFDDPDQYVHGTPFAGFARLRRELDGPATCTRSAWMNRIWSMPVRHRARVPAAGTAHDSAA